MVWFGLEARSEPSAIPNDPLFRAQWGLAKIGATNAWAISKGDSNVVVAVIDTGVNHLHQDLAANMWRNPGETGMDAQGKDRATNGIDDDANGYVDDVHGIDTVDNDSNPMDEGVFNPPFYHGTFIAGQIAAVGNNKLGLVGVGWSIQIMALRLGDRNDVFRAGDLIECLDYIIQMKRRGLNVRITNNSYGGDNSGDEVRQAFARAEAEGIVHVHSSGNQGLDNDFNSAHPRNAPLRSMITVAASSQSDLLHASSQYGKTMVDLAAPVGNMTSTFGPRTNSYTSYDGGATSFAAPYVSGAAALLLSVDPTLTIDELKTALLGSVDVSPALRGKVMSNGRLNVGRALQNLSSNLPPIVIDALPGVVEKPSEARLSVTFSKPMDRPSVEAAWRLSPPVGGTFAWSDGDRTVTFIPEGPLQMLTNYVGQIVGSAHGVDGQSLDGSYNRASEGTPADDFTWNFRVPPTNDDVINAPAIEGISGEMHGTNRNASKETRENENTKGGNPGGASVWYRWTAPATGLFTFDTHGSGFDTLLGVAVRTPDTLERDIIRAIPAYVASNNNDGTLKTSRVSFSARQGVTYNVGVDGRNLPGRIPAAETGEFTLRWYLAPQSLAIKRLSGGTLEISWSGTANGFALESASRVASGWEAVTNQPVVLGARNYVTIDPDRSARFFRLLRQ